MEIRRATAADAKHLSMLIEDLALKFITAEFTAEATAHFLHGTSQRAIEGYIQQGFVYYIAEDDGANGMELIGCVGMRNHSHLYHLFVAQACQGQGIARQLWQHAMTFCSAQGNPGLYTVNASNNAVAVYQALGFVRTGPTQQMHGVLFNPMQLDLRSSTELPRL